MAPQKGQGKKESVTRAAIQLGFRHPKLIGVSTFQEKQLGDGCKIIDVREFLTEKLGAVDGKFQHQNRAPD